MGNSSDGIYCSICNEAISEEEEYLMCGSVCGRAVHLDCTQIKKPAKKIIEQYENIIFSCDECITNSIKTVNNKVDGLYAVLDRMEKKMNSMRDECDAMKKLLGENNIKFTEPSNKNRENNTYANVLKKKQTKVVLVRPKKAEANSDSKKTKEDIKKNFDPKNSKIMSVVNISGGGVAIECKDKTALEAIKIIAEQKLGKEYTIEDAKERKPRVKIVGMNEKHTDEAIVEMIKAQNEYLANDEHVKVIRSYEVNNKYWSAIVEIGKEQYQQCIELGSVNIHWDKCKVYEEVPLTMCMKCCRYNHVAQNCKFERIVCRKCGENHKMSECTANESKCINCETANRKHGFKFDVQHKVDSSNCEVRKQKIEQIRQRLK